MSRNMEYGCPYVPPSLRDREASLLPFNFGSGVHGMHLTLSNKFYVSAKTRHDTLRTTMFSIWNVNCVNGQLNVRFCVSNFDLAHCGVLTLVNVQD